MQRKREIYCFLEKKKLQLNTALFTVTSLIMTSCCVFHEGGRCDSSGKSDGMRMVESPLLNEKWNKLYIQDGQEWVSREGYRG